MLKNLRLFAWVYFLSIVTLFKRYNFQGYNIRGHFEMPSDDTFIYLSGSNVPVPYNPSLSVHANAVAPSAAAAPAISSGQETP